MKNRIYALVLCGAMALALAGCTSSGDKPKDSTPIESPKQSEPAAPTNSVEAFAPPVAPTPSSALESAGTLGDYSSEIKDLVLTKDYAGKAAVIITYTFTNNAEEATSAMLALSGMAFQNGVQLSAPTIMNSSVYDAGNSMLEIKTGGSIDIQRAYSLISDTAPVEFELSELISFSDELLGKTFEIAAGGVTELATLGTLPADAVTGKVDDFEVSILSIAKAKDYKDNDCVTITYGFKNNSDKTANFSTSCSAKAYQDGVQLKSAILTSGTTVEEAISPLTYVKPGAAITVASSYTTTSGSDVEVEVEALFSFGDEKVSRTFSLG